MFWEDTLKVVNRSYNYILKLCIFSCFLSKYFNSYAIERYAFLIRQFYNKVFQPLK